MTKFPKAIEKNKFKNKLETRRWIAKTSSIFDARSKASKKRHLEG